MLSGPLAPTPSVPAAQLPATLCQEALSGTVVALATGWQAASARELLSPGGSPQQMTDRSWYIKMSRFPPQISPVAISDT